MRSKRNFIGPRKSRRCWTWLDRRFSWNENLQGKQKWIAISTNPEENAGRQILPSEQFCELQSLDVALNIAGVEKVSSENLQVQSTLEVRSSFEWKKRKRRWKFVTSVIGDY